MDEIQVDIRNDIAEKFKLTKSLGKGGYAEVFLGESSTTGENVAVKKIVKDKVDRDIVLYEANILSSLHHPNIMSFYGFYEDGEYYYIVTELMKGGELFDRIIQREYYSEGDAKKVITLILQILDYLHSNHVIHRDLKPENNSDDESSLTLSDFGFAVRIKENQKLKDRCGTPEYVAPEILEEKEYDYDVDMWSFGVICYILLCGYPPFGGGNDNDGNRKLFYAIRHGIYEFDSPFWDKVSENAKDFIRRLLNIKGSERMKADEALRHPFITDEANNIQLNDNLKAFKRYIARRKLKKTFNTVRAVIKSKILMAAALQRSRSNSSVDESSSVSSPLPATSLSSSSSSSPSLPQQYRFNNQHNQQQQRQQHSETYTKENTMSTSTPTASDKTNSRLNRLNNSSYLNDDEDIITKSRSLTNTPIKDSYRTLPKKAVKKQTKTITANEMKRPFPLTSISNSNITSPKSSPYQFTAYRKKYDSNDSTNSNTNTNPSAIKTTFRLRSYTSDNPTPPTSLQSLTSTTVNSNITPNYNIPKFTTPTPTIKTGITATATPPAVYRSLYSSSSASTTPNSTPKMSISRNRIRGFKKSSGSDISSPYSSMKESIKKLSKSELKLLEKLWDHSNYDGFKGVNQSNNEIYYIERSLRFPNLLNNVLKTIYYLLHLNHKGISKYECCLEDASYYYIVTESIDCELNTYFVKSQVSENTIRMVLKSIMEVVEYIHDKDLIYRTLCLENLYLRNRNDPSTVKINNFTFTHPKEEMIFLSDSSTLSSSSYLQYTSPEILEQKEYNNKVDVWSLGVIAFTLLCGYNPFKNGKDGNKELFYSIRHGIYNCDGSNWDRISENGKRFVKHLLVVDPNKRYSISNALRDEFILNEGNKLPLKIDVKREKETTQFPKSSSYSRPTTSSSSNTSKSLSVMDIISSLKR